MRVPARARVATLLALVVLAAACNDTERIDLVLTADPGTELRYRITVDSRVVTRLVGDPDVSEERLQLDAVQEVVSVGDDGVIDLEITMMREAEHPRVFEVRLDPRRGLASVDAVQGLPVEALGELGPSRLVLLANGLPPNRPLRPGETWVIERTVDLPEGEGLLEGRGRLSGVEHDGDRAVARVTANTVIPVDRVMTLDRGRVRLFGEEQTRAELDYLIADGTVRGARSVTTGVFSLDVEPPPGTGASPVSGELEVRVESRTVLLEPTGGN